MKMKDRKYGSASSRRLPLKSEPGKIILIVTEGEKTEPIYLLGLLEKLRLPPSRVTVKHAGQTDPLSIINRAIEYRNLRRKESKRNFSVPFDDVWVVFDTERGDSRAIHAEAIAKARSQQIKVALSNPCFEFWLLLHYEFTTAPFENCDRVVRRIREQFFSDYDKSNLPLEQCLLKIPFAVQNAEKCRKHHASAGSDGNPSTDIDLLVRELNLATRPFLRIPID